TGHSRTGAENLFFDVMLHLGTLAAIAVHYRAVIRTGARGLLGSTDVPPAYRRPDVIRTGILAGVATLPLFPYAYFKRYLAMTFESMTVVGIGFLVTATVLLLTIRLRGGEKGPHSMTWLDALLIGIAQAFAPLPGVSRSGLTVAAALGLGLSRAWAVGFSLLIAFPAILGATVMELKDFDPSTLTATRAAQTVAATIVAGAVGYAAIIWLVKIVRAGRMWFFSVYLAILAIAVLAVGLTWGIPDARGTKAVDRPARVGPPGAGARRVGERPVGGLARPLRPGTQPGAPHAGAAASGRSESARLDMGRALAARP